MVTYVAANRPGSLPKAVGGRREDDKGEKDEQVQSECLTKLKPFLGSFNGLWPYANELPRRVFVFEFLTMVSLHHLILRVEKYS